jgi:5-methylcytosine-specific restriction endonuclease McrA
MLDNFKRYQQGYKMDSLFPTRKDGLCSCGCGEKLKGRQTRWASEKCSEKAYSIFSVIKGNNGMIRKNLFYLEEGFCRSCGVFDDNWEADHIKPVFMGGGLCGIDNFQTLCKDCHKDKSKTQLIAQRKAISSQAASSEANVLLYDFEEVL